jgi:hypothetical protein
LELLRRVVASNAPAKHQQKSFLTLSPSPGGRGRPLDAPAAEENRILLAAKEEEATLLPPGEGPGMRESLRLDAG